MTERERLLAEIDEFLAPRDMLPSSFGRLSVADGKFLARIRAGGDVRTATAERVREFMREYKANEAREAARLAQLVAGNHRTKVAA